MKGRSNLRLISGGDPDAIIENYKTDPAARLIAAVQHEYAVMSLADQTAAADVFLAMVQEGAAAASGEAK